MITTSTAAFVLESGSQLKYDGATILPEVVFSESTANFLVKLIVLDATSLTPIGFGRVTLTPTEVDAETGTGSTNTAIWYSALLKAVKTKLLVFNASTTFTIT